VNSTGVVTPWVLFDYGGVVSLMPTSEELQALAAAAGLSVDELNDRYWLERLAYDHGKLTTRDYWETVLLRPVDAELAEQLNEIDAASWMHTDDAVTVLMQQLVRDGRRLALLSNAPEPVAREIDVAAWAQLLERRFFSCRLEMVKPDPAIYREVLRELDAQPHDVTFIDDRPENVEAAQLVGLRAFVFVSPEQLAADLLSPASL
jgi:putative hydrolase of the HAD superfamily